VRQKTLKSAANGQIGKYNFPEIKFFSNKILQFDVSQIGNRMQHSYQQGSSYITFPITGH
jgi:hypothetical protein